jgi:hypothetical protein
MRRLVPLLLAAACSSNTAPMSMTDAGTDGAASSCATGQRPSARKDVDLVSPDGANLLLYGGDTAPFDPMAAVQQKQFVDDLWLFSAGCASWKPAVVNGPTPGPRAAYAAVFDGSKRVLYVAGRAGSGDAPPLVNDVWSLSYDGTALAWTQLKPSGTPPMPRVGHRVVYDATRQRLILFGGDTSAIFGNGIIGDTWELSFASAPSIDGAWRQLAASGAAGAPSPRRDVALVILPERDLVLAFGGARSFSSYLDEVWAFDLTKDSWRKLATAGTVPTPRFAVKAVYDSANMRVLLFGGHDPLGVGLQNDTVAFTLDAAATTATFTRLLPGDSALGVGNVDALSPERREKHGLGLAGSKLYTFGGTSDCGALDDLWSFDLTAATPRWTAAIPALVGETCARRATAGQTCPSDCGNPF